MYILLYKYMYFDAFDVLGSISLGSYLWDPLAGIPETPFPGELYHAGIGNPGATIHAGIRYLHCMVQV